jgi:CRISPR/Cas system CSM-associated protein Csm3 (group 7 of RAMP superfamily)
MASQLCQTGSPCSLRRSTPCPVCRRFGSPQFSGQLYFDNVELPDAYQTLLAEMRQQDQLAARQAMTLRRTHVMLSRRRRSARPNHLFSQEMIRADLPLSGCIVGEVTGRTGADTARLQEDLALLWGAIQLVTHLGRARGRGLGQCALVVTSLQVGGETFSGEAYATALRQLAGGSGP